MRNSTFQVHITVRRASVTARYRLWAEVDGDFGVVLTRSNSLARLRRNAARAIRKQWSMGHLDSAPGRRGAGATPEIVWHQSTRQYARLAGHELSEIRRRLTESERKIRRMEQRLRHAGAYAREARLIAQGQVNVEIDLDRFSRTGRFEIVPWNP
jgi:hypothetical protein